MAIFLNKSQSCYGNSSVKLPLVLSFARIHDSGERLLKPSGDSPNQTCDADSAERESISEISLNSSIRPSRTSTAHGDMLKDEPQTISPLTSRCTSRKEQGTAGRNKGQQEGTRDARMTYLSRTKPSTMSLAWTSMMSTVLYFTRSFLNNGERTWDRGLHVCIAQYSGKGPGYM